MSIALVHLGWILLLITPLAIKLLVWIGVCGCGWPISVSICHKYTASRALRYSAPNSASTADDMTAFMIVAMVKNALLLGGGVRRCLIGKNVLLLGFVNSSHCSIWHCCVWQGSFSWLCMQSLVFPASHNSLTVA